MKSKILVRDHIPLISWNLLTLETHIHTAKEVALCVQRTDLKSLKTFFFWFCTGIFQIVFQIVEVFAIYIIYDRMCICGVW